LAWVADDMIPPKDGHPSQLTYQRQLTDIFVLLLQITLLQRQLHESAQLS